MSKEYRIKHVETNERGHKVVTTVSTDDPEVAKSLIGTAATTSGKKTTKTADKKKTTKESTKKGVVIDAEFTEVKSKKKETKKKPSKKTEAKPKALPAPKPVKKESKTKKETKKSSSGINKHPGFCIFRDKTGRFSVYQETLGFSLYDKNFCVQQLMFETDDTKALKVFGGKIKEILSEEKKKKSP